MTSYVYAGATAARSTEQPGGLLRLTVGEREWQVLDGGLSANAEVRALAVHPDQPHIVYAGTQYGPYRSSDHGEHLQNLSFPDSGMVVWSILVHPQNPQTLFLGTAPSAVYRSDDAGESWQRLADIHTAGEVCSAFPTRVLRLAADPQHPDELYAGMEIGGVASSTDGGTSWQDCTKDLFRLVEQPHLKSQILSDNDAEGMMDTHALTVSAAQSGTVFLATRMGLFQSADRGATWSDLQVGRFSPLTYARDLQVSPHNPNTLYTALSPAARSQDGSVYRSQDLGHTWQRFDHDITPRSTMSCIAMHRQDPDLVYCGTFGGQVFGTHDGGTTWQEYPLPQGLQNLFAIACS